MRRLGLFLLLIAAVAIGSILFNRRNEVGSVNDAIDVLKSSFDSGGTTFGNDENAGPPGQTIRIASFNLGILGPKKLEDPEVMAAIGGILRQFDVVALQEIRSAQPGTVARLLDWINMESDQYACVASHRIGRTSQREQYAFVYRRASIELDTSQSYVVNDPDDLLHREPYVVWCRVRGPEPDRSFTFSLVNVHTDPDEVRQEMQWLDDVFRQVRDDGRGEDDVIMLGDFNAHQENMGELRTLAGFHAAIQSETTNTRRTKQYDNLIFSTMATSEFTGRSGVFDFYHQLDLTMDEALKISDHLPVWAEFTVTEGGNDRLARTTSTPVSLQ